MNLPRVAVLIDLPRGATAGGHVKYWERIAHVASLQPLPFDLTFFFSGKDAVESLSPHVQLRALPPVFSSERLKFLPYVPAHTDLASYHAQLADELASFDLIHTTDAYFAFARTAERVATWNNIPLTTSFHTDTPAYAELFTRHTLHHLLGQKFGDRVDNAFHIAEREHSKKERRLNMHLSRCAAALAMRDQDIARATAMIGPTNVTPMRLGVDKDLFTPQARHRGMIERDYGIEPRKIICLFVGRVDAGKNIDVLAQACANVLAQGANLHLIVAGTGPMSHEVKNLLRDNVSLAGQVAPAELARLYASSDVLAMASDIEIGGMIGLEAIACACPVLASRVSGVAAACGHPPAMIDVDNGIDNWTQALINIARDEAARRDLRAKALAWRTTKIVGWDIVLTQDFMPVWTKALASTETSDAATITPNDDA